MLRCAMKKATRVRVAAFGEKQPNAHFCCGTAAVCGGHHEIVEAVLATANHWILVVTEFAPLLVDFS